MDRIRLAAHDRASGHEEALYDAALLWDVARERHWDRREAPETLFDDRIQIGQLVERGRGILNQLFAQE